MRLPTPAVIAAIAAGCSFDPPTIAPGDDGADAEPAGGDAGPDADPGACPPSYSQAFGTSRYRIASGTWYAGEAACEADGAHLAVVDSAAEGIAIRAFATGDLWIGMSDHRAEGTFRWVNSGAPAETTSPPWDVAQPDDAGPGGDEDCGELLPTGVWNDANCEDTQVYLCECDGIAVPGTPTWCETDIDTACETCTDDCTAMGEVCEDNACMSE